MLKKVFFKKKTSNGIDYATKLQCLKQVGLETCFDFLSLFFNSNPSMYTPEFSSPIYDILIEFMAKCDSFLFEKKFDFSNFKHNLFDSTTFHKYMLDFLYKKLTCFLKETIDQQSTNKNSTCAYFKSLVFLHDVNFNRHDHAKPNDPKIEIVEFQLFEKKIINLMYFLIECIDKTCPCIPKIKLTDEFPDFEYLEYLLTSNLDYPKIT